MDVYRGEGAAGMGPHGHVQHGPADLGSVSSSSRTGSRSRVSGGRGDGVIAGGVSGTGMSNGGVSGGGASNGGVSGGGVSEGESQARQAASCLVAHDPNLVKLANAIAARVGPQRFHVWFDNSTRLDLRNDGLEIAVPNDFIGEWIGQRFAGTIQEAAAEVFGGPLRLRFQVVPELFEGKAGKAGKTAEGGAGALANRRPAAGGKPSLPDDAARHAATRNGHAVDAASAIAARRQSANGPLSGTAADLTAKAADLQALVRPGQSGARPGQPGTRPGQPGAQGGTSAGPATAPGALHPASRGASPMAGLSGTVVPGNRARLRHDLGSYVVGPGNQLAFNAALHVAEFPGSQYNPLFIHGGCGLGKTHLLQGLCQKFIQHHPTRRWLYVTGEEFTNEYLTALRMGKVEAFRRKMRELDLLVIDDVHFLSGKKATQEEFLHTFNAIEALGRQVVMASDSHPKEIAEFGESLVNRFVSGMVVRVDPPNFAMRCEILRRIAFRTHLPLTTEVIEWVARRVTQNVRELEGAATRIAAYVQLTGRTVTVELAQEALGELDRAMVAPVKPENVLATVANHFGIEAKDLMSGRRHHTVSLARSIAMYLVRKTAKLSYPEIGHRLGKRNHSTVISACRRIESAVAGNEKLTWSGALGDRDEEAAELVARLEEHARSMA